MTDRQDVDALSKFDNSFGALFVLGIETWHPIHFTKVLFSVSVENVFIKAIEAKQDYMGLKQDTDPSPLLSFCWRKSQSHSSNNGIIFKI